MLRALQREAAAEAAADSEQRAQMLRQVEIARLLHELPKPTLAAIPGAAAGAGLSLALPVICGSPDAK